MRKVAAKYPGQVEVVRFLTLSEEGQKYGIMMCPAVVINDKLVVSGKVPSEGDLEKLYKKELGIK